MATVEPSASTPLSLSTSPSATFPFVPPEDPGTSYGTDGVDVKDWLALFETASVPNRWDPTLQLDNVLFYLRGTEKVCYENNEELTSWDQCKEKFREEFGKASGRKIAAKKELACCVLSFTESYLSYIQDMVAHCRKTDNNMTKGEKVGPVLKGIANDAFNILMCEGCSTADAIIEECRLFEQTKSRRILQPFARLPNTAATSTCENQSAPQHASPPEDFKRIVRRELEATAVSALHLRSADATPVTVPLVEALVRQELENIGVHSVCSVGTPRASERPSVMSSSNQRSLHLLATRLSAELQMTAQYVCRATALDILLVTVATHAPGHLARRPL